MSFLTFFNSCYEVSSLSALTCYSCSICCFIISCTYFWLTSVYLSRLDWNMTDLRSISAKWFLRTSNALSTSSGVMAGLTREFLISMEINLFLFFRSGSYWNQLFRWLVLIPHELLTLRAS